MISIPVIVLRKTSINRRRKLSIAAVLCLSVFMIAIGFLRAISAGVIGTEDQSWNMFWVQLEASVSAIAACPVAFRSLFLVTQSSKDTPERINVHQGQTLVTDKEIGSSQFHLRSIKVGATLVGMRSVIENSGEPENSSQDEDEYSLPPSAMRQVRWSPASMASVDATHETSRDIFYHGL